MREKITPAQRARLLASYLEHGFHATKALAVSYGVQPKYLSRLARNAGPRRNYQDKGPTRGVAPKARVAEPKKAKAKAAPARTTKSARWSWAIQRGGISI